MSGVSSFTPMMQQYLQIKEQYKDAILMYRLGDFYEMFFEDAEIASRELEITLTGRDCGLPERAPMCGVPFHSVDSYIAKLISKGYRVAICEQMEDPALAKGLVKREVVRIITPGTVTDSSMLEDKKNNYLMSIIQDGNRFGISVVDISTGDFTTTQLEGEHAENRLFDEVAKFGPSELIVNDEFRNNERLISRIKNRFHTFFSYLDEQYFLDENARKAILDHFSQLPEPESASASGSPELSLEPHTVLESVLSPETKSVPAHESISEPESSSVPESVSDSESVDYAEQTAVEACAASENVAQVSYSGAEKGKLVIDRLSLHPFSLCASGALLYYLHTTQKVNLSHIQNIRYYSVEDYMLLDASTRRNLELTESMREKSKKGTLLWVLDRTVTSMGGRLLRKWIEMPLVKKDEIQSRLDAVEELKNDYLSRAEIIDALKKVYDIERLMSRIVYGSANCRDLISLKTSIGQVPTVLNLAGRLQTPLIRSICSSMDTLSDIYHLIDSSIIDDPPISLREGGFIKSTYNSEVDRLRRASTEGKQWIASFEAAEKERTGIKNLRIGFNRVFGYYIEVTNSYLSQVPDYYIRKQTLTNCERYITQELKEIEDTILGAEEKVMDLEYKLFQEIRQQVNSQVSRINRTAAALAQLDVLCALAEVAEQNQYCKPEITEGEEIDIVDGRHPVVELVLEDSLFVPNDTHLDLDENRLLIITGPNMAGKSTYLRQVALITLMAQMGSFVPASHAKIGIVDRIFTRVGASDDLAAGQSTFMVEMSEVANILANATHRSLLILDEIGRGTSTFDGLSIAWAVIEYINNPLNLGSRTLFATHYHELTELEGKMQGIKNYCISVKKRGDDIIFLRKIIRGGADGSYGIQVARLAGLPEEVLRRAGEILKYLEDSDINKREFRRFKKNKPIDGQLDLFAMLNKDVGQEKPNQELVQKIMKVDVSTITPIEALNIIYELQKEIRDKGWQE